MGNGGTLGTERRRAGFVRGGRAAVHQAARPVSAKRGVLKFTGGGGGGGVWLNFCASEGRLKFNAIRKTLNLFHVCNFYMWKPCDH
jgi:hypothetical protein